MTTPIALPTTLPTRADGLTVSPPPGPTPNFPVIGDQRPSLPPDLRVTAADGTDHTATVLQVVAAILVKASVKFPDRSETCSYSWRGHSIVTHKELSAMYDQDLHAEVIQAAMNMVAAIAEVQASTAARTTGQLIPARENMLGDALAPLTWGIIVSRVNHLTHSLVKDVAFDPLGMARIHEVLGYSLAA